MFFLLKFGVAILVSLGDSKLAAFITLHQHIGDLNCHEASEECQLTYIGSFSIPRSFCGYSWSSFFSIKPCTHIFNLPTFRLLVIFQAPDSTFFEWSPDGIHFLTATTSPRLKIDNG